MTDPSSQGAAAFPALPVVGVGASAGGLDAFERFFAGVPRDCPAAFVVIQHLDPTRKGLLTELLQRESPLHVTEIVDRVLLEAGRVYVIPPNRTLTIDGDVLHIVEPLPVRGPTLPIDVFFRSLAAERGVASIGVVLTGMGTDGTLGMQAIKDAGGMTFVQDPATAQFDGMPRSVVETGAADVVGTVEDLATAVVEHITSGGTTAAMGLTASDETPARVAAATNAPEYAAIVELLLARTGHDLSLYKPGTVSRRIERRMALQQIKLLGDYVRFLREHPTELDRLHRELLIGVTSFFRDPQVWDVVRDEVLPRFFAAHPEGAVLRAWCPACSTGEEAFTLAMVFREALELAAPAARFSLRLFATDIDPAAIDRARTGRYPAGIAADVSPERLERFFTRDDSHFQVNKSLREMIVFATHDVAVDPPFTRLDLVSCRNLLIYLAPELQRRLVPMFHYALEPDGVLVLGSAEALGEAERLFTPVAESLRVYRRRETAATVPAVAVRHPVASRDSLRGEPTGAWAEAASAQIDHVVERLLVRSYAPPAVLTNDRGDIVFVSGRTGKYLEPPSGKANWNLLAMARDGLRVNLSRAFRAAVQSGAAQRADALQVELNDPTEQVSIAITPVSRPEVARGLVLVVFEPVPPASAGTPSSGATTAMAGASAAVAPSPDVERLNAELRSTNSELQAAYDDVRAAHEELAALYEQLQSTYEELQSTNEELTISMEEMQSMNEELQTLNTELETRVNDYMRVSDDMDNLLDSTDIATLFLDGALRVRRFTPRLTSIVSIRSTDVGRPITDLVSHLGLPEFASDVESVLTTKVAVVREVPTDDGRWFAVKSMPYRTHEERIDGAVVTFSDITAAKALEAELREAKRVLEGQLAATGTHTDTHIDTQAGSKSEGDER